MEHPFFNKTIRMKAKQIIIRFLGLVCLSVLFFFPVFAQNTNTTTDFEYAEDNQKCLQCHGHQHYYYNNDWLEKTVRERMNPYFVIDSAEYYVSNHKNFACTDCHSYDYSKFPHSGELRMEEIPGCMDCHGGDDTYAKFNFEQIEVEFHNSVHSSKHSEDFTCWMCHNPHSYKINTRSNEKLIDIIQYDNNICLSCHADVSKYKLLTTVENPNILEKHEWLPNQILHFQNVRCIECHTEISNDVLVAHNVRTKDKAVKRCVECHSQNSLLQETLYKYQQEGDLEIHNGRAKSDQQLIGGNRIYELNFASIVIFLLTLGGIGLHIVLRIIFKSK